MTTTTSMTTTQLESSSNGDQSSIHRSRSAPSLKIANNNNSESSASGVETAAPTSDSEGSGDPATERALRKAGRRKRRSSHTFNVSGDYTSHKDEESHGDACSEEACVPKEAVVYMTWKETITGVLMVGAFGTCLSVLFLLQKQQENSDVNDQECDSRTLLQIKLASYIHNGGNISRVLATAEGAAALESVWDSQVLPCGCPSAQQLVDFETVVYMLLVAALLTVVGVSIVLVDDDTMTCTHNMNMNMNMMPSHLLTYYAVKEVSERIAGNGKQNKPIADLFPDTTVLFADIVGFEAWSSQREPVQCLTLLEAIYVVFDRQARLQGVFKVEAVADCYTAATGLPESRKDHAEAMLKFAHTCLKLFKETTKSLEVSLGPDTSDLSLRAGIHSGPVTALRGGSSRFQLFGETVTTASSILSSSQAGKVQLSYETVQLLPHFLQTEWVTLRKAKGKYDTKLYWLSMPGQAEEDNQAANEDRIPRLVDWNVQILVPVLEQIVAKRHAANAREKLIDEKAVDRRLRQGKLVIDEVEEVIKLPKYNADLVRAQEEQKKVKLRKEVVDQLRDYIMTIAHFYKHNPFHNFDHASHVTMSVSKLLSRILAPKLEVSTFNFDKSDKSEFTLDDDDDDDDDDEMDDSLKHRIHDHTYGITSDPLTQFACMFSALIHDAEHDGVPNVQLIKEETALAARYNNQSVAEQNSLDISWRLLMENRFKALRSAIYSSEEEMIHFRKLIVNCVMATDICDKQLKELRNTRWDRAFSTTGSDEEDDANLEPEVLEEDVNRKATIVIEHIIQASDVSHTMQHFHVFRTWNERLFMEMYMAYKNGRSTSDPSTFWYKGEIGFFDFYVIPLAKKLKECGVFGVSSDEYLNYATKNRREWESKGEGIVEELVTKAELLYARLKLTEIVGLTQGKRASHFFQPK